MPAKQADQADTNNAITVIATGASRCVATFLGTNRTRFAGGGCSQARLCANGQCTSTRLRDVHSGSTVPFLHLQ